MKRRISIFALLLSAVFEVGLVGGLHADTYENVYAWFVSTGGNWNGSDRTHITPNSGVLYASRPAQPLSFTALPPDGYRVTRWLWNENVNSVKEESNMSEITGSKVSDDKKTCTLTYSGDGSRALGVRFDYITFELEFDPNGPYGTMPSDDGLKDLNYDSTIDLPPCEFKRPGYGMTEWTNAVGTAFADEQRNIKGSAFWNPAITNFSARLYAKWVPNTYKISYTGLDDTTGYPESAVYDSAIELPEPERRGFTFEGWNIAEGLGSMQPQWHQDQSGWSTISTTYQRLMADSVNPVKTIWLRNLNPNDRANVTINANWTTNTYKINLKFTGAKNDPTPDVSVRYGAVPDGVGKVPEYDDGMVFAGYADAEGNLWYDAQGELTPAYANYHWDRVEDLNLTAQKAGIEYFITYDRNAEHGGTGTEPAKQTCNTANEITLPSGDGLRNPGHVLAGWSKNYDADPRDGESVFGPGSHPSYSDLGVTKDNREIRLWAVWKDKRVSIAVDATGGTACTNGVKVTSLIYVDGEKYGFLPTAEKGHYVFAGWFTKAEGGEPVTEDSTVDYETVKTIYAQWTPEKFFVAFDRNGATNDEEMAVQEFDWDEEQALSGNLYGRIGYVFDGWATNTVAFEKAFNDCQVVSNLVGIANATQTIYAVWKTNTYTVGFLPGGAMGTMEDQPFVYDQPQALNPCIFVRGDSDLWSFAGWTNSVGHLYEPGETVLNLTAEPNGRVELTAVWKSTIGPLSEAMGCDNLKWVDGDVNNEKEGWERCETEGCDRVGQDGHPPCVMQSGPDSDYKGKWMHANISTNGTLSFWYRLSDASAWIAVNVCSPGEDPTYVGRLSGESGKWLHATFDIPFQSLQGYCIEITHFDGGDVYIDQMTWTPEGAHPVPVDGEDNVTISSAAVSDGKFSLSFDSKAEFDYNLLTNANLLIDSWGVMTNEVGTGKTITFEPQIIEGQPQMFYKVETIKKE